MSASSDPVEIVELPAQVVVGEFVAAPFDRLHVEVPAAWRRLAERGEHDGVRLAEASIQTHAGYVEVVGVLSEPDAVVVPNGQVPVLVPAGRYARLVHHGSPTGIADGFGRIYAWAEDRGVTLGARKLDVGYETDGPHELFIDVVDDERP